MVRKSFLTVFVLGLFIFVLGAGQAAGQVVLVDEGFEGTYPPPTGWATYQTGDATDPGFVQIDAGTVGFNIDPHGGTYCVAHGDDNLSTDAISWLVTPQLVISNDQFSLHFWQADYYQSYYQYHGVWVSTASGDPASGDFIELWTADTTETWEEITESLAAYNGQSIYLAFRYEGDYMDEWYIDDVTVDSPVPVELMSFSIE